jgi:hypothetical protein
MGSLMVILAIGLGQHCWAIRQKRIERRLGKESGPCACACLQVRLEELQELLEQAALQQRGVFAPVLA